MKYKNPPVVETVLSVQFKPFGDFGAGQLGAFWRELGTEWPHVTDAPAIDPVYERFESDAVWEQAAFVKFSSKMDVRLQIRNESRDRMIQVQNGRFFYNWLKTPETDYPSYDLVLPGFIEHWDKFHKFIISQKSTCEIEPNLWEVLYVNHIPQGVVWNELSDIPEVLTFLRQPELTGLKVLAENIGGEWSFVISPKKGRLYVTLGMKMKRDVRNLVITLTARGPIGDGFGDLHEGLNLGHKVVTEAFSRITSKRAQDYWGVIQ